MKESRRIHRDREGSVNCGEKLVDCFRVVPVFSVPIDDERKEDPSLGGEQATRYRACVEARKINVATLGVSARAEWQRHKIDKITERENSAVFAHVFRGVGRSCRAR